MRPHLVDVEDTSQVRCLSIRHVTSVRIRTRFPFSSQIATAIASPCSASRSRIAGLVDAPRGPYRAA